MKVNTRSVAIPLIVVVILACLSYAFFQLYERKLDSNWKPLTGEARANPLFASRLFLKRMGIPASSQESLQGISQLPSVNSVIILTAPRHRLTEEKVDQLLEWVSEGGHLIIQTIGSSWEEDYYLDESPLVDETKNEKGTEPERTSSDLLQNALKVHSNPRDHIIFKDEEPREIQLPNANRPLQMAHNHYHPIILDSDNESVQLEKVQLDGKNLILRQGLGAGMVTLVSRLHFIEYRELADYDHAEILWHLVHRDSTELSSPDEVWLIHSDEVPNLISLIWKQFWAFIIMLSVLLLIWAIRASRRFGPVIPKQGEDRRHLMEHIKASGAYYWKQKQGDVLLNSTRAVTTQRLSQRIPGWQSLTKDQQAEAVANRLNLETTQVFQTLHGNINHSPHDFTEIIKQLEYIRTNV